MEKKVTNLRKYLEFTYYMIVVGLLVLMTYFVFTDNGNVDILMLAVIMVVAVGIYGRPRKKP